MTATNVSYSGEMYQVITRTFFTFSDTPAFEREATKPSLKHVLQILRPCSAPIFGRANDDR